MRATRHRVRLRGVCVSRCGRCRGLASSRRSLRRRSPSVSSSSSRWASRKRGASSRPSAPAAWPRRRCRSSLQQRRQAEMRLGRIGRVEQQQRPIRCDRLVALAQLLGRLGQVAVRRGDQRIDGQQPPGVAWRRPPSPLRSRRAPSAAGRRRSRRHRAPPVLPAPRARPSTSPSSRWTAASSA